MVYHRPPNWVAAAFEFDKRCSDDVHPVPGSVMEIAREITVVYDLKQGTSPLLLRDWLWELTNPQEALRVKETSKRQHNEAAKRRRAEKAAVTAAALCAANSDATSAALALLTDKFANVSAGHLVRMVTSRGGVGSPPKLSLPCMLTILIGAMPVYPL